MAALVFLFLAEGQRAFFSVLFGLSHDAVFPAFRWDLAAVLLLLVVGTLLLPLVPLARWVQRPAAAVTAVAGVAVFRVPVTLPDLWVRAVASALVVGCAASFLVWSVTYLGRRTLAVGLVAGLVADQLLRLAGTSWDVSLRPGWVPVQAVLSLGLLLLALSWGRRLREDQVRAAERAAESGGLERRASGIRLRGALSLGVLLFLDLHVLALPAVAARWTGVGYGTAALLVTAGGAVALGVVLARSGPLNGRAGALALVAVVAVGMAMGWHMGGVGGVVGVASAHAAALLLMARAVEPARGRRGRGVVPAGFLVFMGLVALFVASHFHGFLPLVPGGLTPWVLASTGAVLAALFALLPQLEFGRMVRPIPGAAASLVVMALAVILSPEGPARQASTGPGVGSPGTGGAERSGEAGSPGPSGGALTLATYNVHYGFDETWRFDPEAIAAALRAADADIAVLQEVTVGLPAGLGADLGLWLEHRLGMTARFQPGRSRLRGQVVLSRASVGVLSHRLPGDGDPRTALVLEAQLGGDPLPILAVHLTPRDDARPEQAREALALLPPGPAVVLGDLNAEAGAPAIAALQGIGFADAFEAAGSSPEPTWPAGAPTRRLDWIWVRGVAVGAASVLPHNASDHRLVTATIHPLPAR